MDEKQINQIKQNIEAATRSLNAAKKVLNAYLQGENQTNPMINSNQATTDEENLEGKVIEGVFDGQNMVGPDGKLYSVPANYASKSKLVEGDTMKLTITPDGSFQYKQIGPIDRERLVGVLAQEEDTDQYYVLANNHSYKILLASVTYFKGEIGDEVVILKPKESESEWAAVENIIKNIKGAEKTEMLQVIKEEEKLPEPEEQHFIPETSEISEEKEKVQEPEEKSFEELQEEPVPIMNPDNETREDDQNSEEDRISNMFVRKEVVKQDNQLEEI